MITKIAYDFIKQANPYEAYDDTNIATEHPIATAAGVGATAGAGYGLGKYLSARKDLNLEAAEDAKVREQIKKTRDLVNNTVEPLEKRRAQLAEDIIPNSSKAARGKYQEELQKVIAKQRLNNAHLRFADSAEALADTMSKRRQTEQAFLNSAKGKLKYIGKPAAIGAGVLGTGTLAAHLYNKFHSE